MGKQVAVGCQRYARLRAYAGWRLDRMASQLKTCDSAVGGKACTTCTGNMQQQASTSAVMPKFP